MRFPRLFLAIFLVALAVFVFNKPLRFGGTAIPPLGKVLSPYTGLLQNAEPVDSRETLRFNVNGLEDPVKIVFDERRVPHIFASSYEDACYAQGFLHAKNRLFQMQLISMAAGGRLAEMLGEVAVEYDRSTRKKGMVLAAEIELAGIKADTLVLAAAESYCRGVNDYMKTLHYRNLPPEFKLLDFYPLEWTLMDLALVIQSLTYDLSFRHDDPQASAALRLTGTGIYEELFPRFPPFNSPVVQKNEWGFDTIVRADTGLIEGSRLPGPGNSHDRNDLENLGSNNWAVSAEKTADGYAILANDPHLQLSLPSIWYEVQISCPQTNVYGTSLPGIPGVVLGFNEHIAWGSTNGSQDVLDWFAIDWVDRERGIYRLDDMQVQAYPKREVIAVKGARDVVDTVWYTMFGPAGHRRGLDSTTDFALYWLAHKDFGISELSAFLGFNLARTHADFQSAVEKFSVPAQNFVFASNADTIAMHVQGRLPVRTPHDGIFLKKGIAARQARWKFIPQDQLPCEINPERGFVSSANQASVDTSYPYALPGYYDHYRGRYLNRRLAQLNDIEIEAMMRLQTDVYSLEAEETVQCLLPLIERNALDHIESTAYDSLSSWDFKFQPGSKTAVIYYFLSRKFHQLVWDEFYGKPNDPLIPEHWRTMELVREDPESPWFDLRQTTKKESVIQIADSAFSWAAMRSDSLFKKMSIINWASFKDTRISHLTRIPAFGERVRTGGHKRALNAITATKGPSWRMIVQMQSPPRAWVVCPGGQSGNPGSAFYDTGIEKWVKGGYFPVMLYSNPEEVPGENKNTIQFNPAR